MSSVFILLECLLPLGGHIQQVYLTLHNGLMCFDHGWQYPWMQAWWVYSPGLHSCIMPISWACINLLGSTWCLNAALECYGPGLHSCIMPTKDIVHSSAMRAREGSKWPSLGGNGQDPKALLMATCQVSSSTLILTLHRVGESGSASCKSIYSVLTP